MTVLTVYGNSYAAGVGASVPARRWSTLLAQRFAWTEVNRAVAGERSREVLGHALGSADPRAWTTGADGLVAVQCALNDLRYFGVGVLGLREFRHSLRTLLALLTVAGARAEHTAVDLYGGAWTTGSYAQSSGASNTYTTAQYASATVGFNDVEVNVLVPVLPGAGPLVEFRIDGVTQRIVDYSAQCTTGPVTVTERFAGMAAGHHVLTMTKLDASAAPMYLDCFLFPLAAQRTQVILVDESPIPSWSGYAPFNQGSLLALDTYRGALASVAAEFPTVRVADPRPAWNPATMVAGDGVHPNDLGHQTIADATIGAALALGFV